MEFFLLLSALICGLTGTVRTAVVRAPAVIAARQVVSVDVAGTRAAAVRAYALVVRVVTAPRPDGYVAPRPLTLDARPLVAAGRAAPERRRE